MLGPSEPLLDLESQVEAPARRGANCKDFTEVLAVTVLFLFSGQLIALTQSPAEVGGSVNQGEMLMEAGPLCRYYDLLKPAAPIITMAGTFLFVLIFILSSINKVKGFSNTVKNVQGMGLPCPTVMTVLCILDIIAGSVCYLTGVPVLMEWGAEFLLIFLILASYYGHFKPWMETKEEFHMEMLMKNLALMGQCLLTIGFEVPEIGKDGTPLGLGGRLGKFGQLTGQLYGVLKPYSFIFKYMGIVMFLLIFLMGGIKHLRAFKETVDINKHFGIPFPTLSAVAAILMLLSGSLLFLTGIPVYMEAGAEILLMFLVISTFFVHLIPLRQTGDFKQMLHTLKNVSMAGGCLMTIGAVLPRICQ